MELDDLKMKPPVQHPRAAPTVYPAAAALAERRAERRSSAAVIVAIFVTAAALTFGAGLVGSSLDESQDFHDGARLSRLVEQTSDAIAALPFDELAALDGASEVVPGPEGATRHRLELTVSRAPDGLRIHTVIIDNRTREAVADFIAWRGRS